MSTLAQLRAMVSRDLRDPLNATFLPVYVDDLINAGIEEIDRVYPMERVIEISPTVGQVEFDLLGDVSQIVRVEVWGAATTTYRELPEQNGVTGSGWDFWGGKLYVPGGWLLAPDTLKVWAYGGRAQLTTDSQIAELDTTSEWGVRHFARASAFNLMQNDRALFKQWQAMSQNSDLSPNQLTQMLATATNEWDRSRNYLRKLRRI
jgi:hypothetical protein